MKRLSIFACSLFALGAAPYSDSTYITDVTFDCDSIATEAGGSDNWPITWATNGHQYTSWGDGGGFGGSDSACRMSLGMGRVEGTKDSYTGYDVWGCDGAGCSGCSGYSAGCAADNCASTTGKSRGILAIGNTLYMWVSGAGSNNASYDFQELYKSTDGGANWATVSVNWQPSDFTGEDGCAVFSFVNYSQGHAGAPGDYVYTVGFENQDDIWNVQTPGELCLLRVHKDNIETEGSWEWFSGTPASPAWDTDPDNRTFHWEDATNGVMRSSITWHAGVSRYILIAQQVDRNEIADGYIGMYEAANPWGPWKTILFGDAWGTDPVPACLQTGSKTVFWNLSTKWSAEMGGGGAVMVYTGPGADAWGTIELEFTYTASSLIGTSLRGVSKN